MKTDEFKKIIREVVNEELLRILPKLLDRRITEGKTPPIEHIQPTPTAPPIPVKKELKRYIKDPILNQILNETKVTITQEPTYPGVYSELNMNATGMNMLNEIAVPHSSEVGSNQPSSREEPATKIEKVFMKDYSKLLKAVEAKSKK